MNGDCEGRKSFSCYSEVKVAVFSWGGLYGGMTVSLRMSRGKIMSCHCSTAYGSNFGAWSDGGAGKIQHITIRTTRILIIMAIQHRFLQCHTKFDHKSSNCKNIGVLINFGLLLLAGSEEKMIKFWLLESLEYLHLVFFD